MKQKCICKLSSHFFFHFATGYPHNAFIKTQKKLVVGKMTMYENKASTSSHKNQ